MSRLRKGYYIEYRYKKGEWKKWTTNIFQTKREAHKSLLGAKEWSPRLRFRVVKRLPGYYIGKIK